MRLLVSAANAADAAAALEGGAAFIDAKDPAAGALGAVSFDVFRAIADAVGGRRPVTAAAGDAESPASIETGARTFARLGAQLVKVGFADITDVAAVTALARAAIEGARSAGAGVVLVAYADRMHDGVSPLALLDVAASTGAAGVLLDTADKLGPRLTELIPPASLRTWVERARRLSLMAAVAGRLRAGDLPIVRESGADVAGVRGAACAGGRGGVVDAARVRALADACMLETSPL